MWLRDFRCLNCGSSTGKRYLNPHTNVEDNICAFCEVGERELLEAKEEAADFPSVLEATGRRSARLHKILEESNTPDSTVIRHEIVTSNESQKKMTFGGFGDLSDGEIALISIIINRNLIRRFRGGKKC